MGDAGMIRMKWRDVQRNAKIWKIHFFGYAAPKLQSGKALQFARLLKITRVDAGDGVLSCRDQVRIIRMRRDS